MALLLVATLAFMFATDTILGFAREFEHGLDSKVEKPERETKEHKYHSMIATAYCLNGTTATQTQTRKGICAGKREWFGQYAVVYADNNGEIGDLIGVYHVEDTGGEAIRSGRVLDIWMPTEEECLEFGNKKVHVYLMKEETR